MHAAKLAEEFSGFKSTAAPFSLIISSPYLRCVETAASVARNLRIPLYLDLDLGEVFDEEYMPHNANGDPMHRSPDELSAILARDFPDVVVVRDGDGKVVIGGTSPIFPEAFESAQLRFTAKAQAHIKHATRNLASIIMVGHADAVPCVHRLLNQNGYVPGPVPFCGYIVAERDVTVARGTSDVRVAAYSALKGGGVKGR